MAPLVGAAQDWTEHPQPTADMTPTDIRVLWYFDVQIRRAAKELGIPAPKVVNGRGRTFPFSVAPTTAAFVWPDPRTAVVIVMPRAASWRDSSVQCFARHEMAHLALGHRGGCVTRPGSDECDLEASRQVIAQHHAEVAQLMRATWREDSRCE